MSGPDSQARSQHAGQTGAFPARLMPCSSEQTQEVFQPCLGKKAQLSPASLPRKPVPASAAHLLCPGLCAEPILSSEHPAATCPGVHTFICMVPLPPWSQAVLAAGQWQVHVSDGRTRGQSNHRGRVPPPWLPEPSPPETPFRLEDERKSE